MYSKKKVMDTLQEINISHSGEKEKHLQNWHFRGYVSSQEGILYDFFRHQLGYQTISSWPLDLDRVHGPCRSFSNSQLQGIPEQFPIKNPRKHSDSMRILWRFRFGDCLKPQSSFLWKNLTIWCLQNVISLLSRRKHQEIFTIPMCQESF